MEGASETTEETPDDRTGLGQILAVLAIVVLATTCSHLRMKAEDAARPPAFEEPARIAPEPEEEEPAPEEEWQDPGVIRL